MNAEEVIARLKQTLGVSKDKELADALGKSRNYVYTLKSRNTIPYEDCVDVAHKTGASLDWLLMGKEGAKGAGCASDGSQDPRIGRLISFFTNSPQKFEPDEIAWMEQQIRRAIPEYDDFLHREHQGGSGQ